MKCLLGLLLLCELNQLPEQKVCEQYSLVADAKLGEINRHLKELHDMILTREEVAALNTLKYQYQQIYYYWQFAAKAHYWYQVAHWQDSWKCLLRVRLMKMGFHQSPYL